MLYLDKLEFLGKAIKHPIKHGKIKSPLFEQMYADLDNTSHSLVTIIRNACHYARKSDCSILITWATRDDVRGLQRADEFDYTVQDISDIVVNPDENFDDILKSIYIRQFKELPNHIQWD